eukprot:1188163-Prorocentrum_minimum.AAC.1
MQLKEEVAKEAAATEKAAVGRSDLESTTATAPVSKQPAEKPTKKLSWREQKEFEELEAAIEVLNKRQAEINVVLAKGGDDYDKLTQLTEELSTLMTENDEKSERWLELAERAEA